MKILRCIEMKRHLEDSNDQLDKSEEVAVTTDCTLSDDSGDKKQNSLRRDKIEYNPPDETGIKATPEVKKIVASKLSDLIEKSIAMTNSSCDDIIGKSENSADDEDDDGIKLFSDSKVIFSASPKLDDTDTTNQSQKPDLLGHRNLFLKHNTKADFESVAVSSEWVLMQQGVFSKGSDISKSKLITEL